MSNISLELLVGILLGLAIYVGLGIFTLKVENDYRKAFSLPATTIKQNLRNLLVGALAMLIYHFLCSAKIPVTATPFLWAAAAALAGAWRVDRVFLLIPDRFQIIGLVSGLCFMAAYIQSGESASGTLLEVGFALLLVGLLWLLSIAYEKLRGTIGFGFGDTKLLAWLSFFVGKRMPNLIFIAVVVGILSVVLRIVISGIRNKKWSLPGGQDAFAFGPSIVMAVFIEGLLFYG